MFVNLLQILFIFFLGHNSVEQGFNSKFYSFNMLKGICYDNFVDPSTNTEIFCDCYRLSDSLKFPSNYLYNSTFLGKIVVNGIPCASYAVNIGSPIEFMEIQGKDQFLLLLCLFLYFFCKANSIPVLEIAITLDTSEIKQIKAEYGIIWTFDEFDYASISDLAFGINLACPLALDTLSCTMLNSTRS
jgi:hypothetical protein